MLEITDLYFRKLILALRLKNRLQDVTQKRGRKRGREVESERERENGNSFRGQRVL